MNNLFLKLLFSPALVLLLLIGGCGKKFDEASFSKDLCSQLIVPAHAELASQAVRLQQAVSRFAREQDERSLLPAQTEWHRAVAVQQRCKPFHAPGNKAFTEVERALFDLGNRLFNLSKGNGYVLRGKNPETLTGLAKNIAEKTRLLHTNWQQQETTIALQEQSTDQTRSFFATLSGNMWQLPLPQQKTFSPTDRSALYLYHHLTGLYQLFNGGTGKNVSYQGFYDYLCMQGKAGQAAEISLQFKHTLLAFEVLRSSSLQDRHDREAFYREYEKLRTGLGKMIEAGD